MFEENQKLNGVVKKALANTLKYEKHKATVFQNKIVFYKGRQNEKDDCNNKHYLQPIIHE